MHPSLNYFEAHEHMKVDCGVHINERKIFRSLKEARVKVKGSIKQQYAKL